MQASVSSAINFKFLTFLPKFSRSKHDFDTLRSLWRSKRFQKALRQINGLILCGKVWLTLSVDDLIKVWFLLGSVGVYDSGSCQNGSRVNTVTMFALSQGKLLCNLTPWPRLATGEN